MESAYWEGIERRSSSIPVDTDICDVLHPLHISKGHEAALAPILEPPGDGCIARAFVNESVKYV